MYAILKVRHRSSPFLKCEVSHSLSVQFPRENKHDNLISPKRKTLMRKRRRRNENARQLDELPSRRRISPFRRDLSYSDPGGLRRRA